MFMISIICLSFLWWSDYSFNGGLFLVFNWTLDAGLELSVSCFCPFLPPVHSSHSALSPDHRYRPCGLWRKLQTASVRNRSASSFLQPYPLIIHPLDSHSRIILIPMLFFPCFSFALCTFWCSVWLVDALSSAGILKASWCATSVFQNVFTVHSFIWRETEKHATFRRLEHTPAQTSINI